MKRILLLAFFLLSAGICRAQLTLNECRRMAREHYPEIRQYDLIRQTTDYTLSNVSRAWLPQFQLAGQATWQSAVTDFPDRFKQLVATQNMQFNGLHKTQYKLSLEVNQTLWDGGASRAERCITEADERISLRSTDVDMYALEGRVDELYFGILMLERRIDQTRLTLDLLGNNLEKIRSLLRNGVAEQGDVDAVEAEQLTVHQQLEQTEATRESYRRMLGLFMGKELGEETLQLPEVVEPVLSESNRPELAFFEANAEKLVAQQRAVKASTRPRFGLFAQGYYGYPGLNFFEDMMRDSWSWNAIVGVKMQWNFGAYYTRGNSLRKLHVAQQRVEVERDVFLFNNQLQSVQERDDIARLRKALLDDDRIVQLRRAVREAAESKLRNGVIDTTDLLDKITAESLAVLTRSAREIELLKMIYELKHTTNR